MVLMTYHNPLEGVTFRVIGVAHNHTTAKEYLRNYWSGVPSEWQELITADTYTLIRWINKETGHCYLIQEVQVYR